MMEDKEVVRRILVDLMKQYPDSGFLVIKTDIEGERTKVHYNGNFTKKDTIEILGKVKLMMELK